MELKSSKWDSFWGITLKCCPFAIAESLESATRNLEGFEVCHGVMKARFRF